MSLRSKTFGWVAALAAASSISCHSTPTHLFTLYAIPSTTPAAAYQGPAIRIDAVHVPPALDRIEVVNNEAPGQLKISDVDYWSAPLGQAARQALSADMVSRLPPERLIFPHLAKPADALGIVVDVLDFKTDGNGASLEASWSLVSSDPKGGPVPRQVALRTTGSGTGAAATARALSALLAQLAEHIVADLQSRCCNPNCGTAAPCTTR